MQWRLFYDSKVIADTHSCEAKHACIKKVCKHETSCHMANEPSSSWQTSMRSCAPGVHLYPCRHVSTCRHRLTGWPRMQVKRVAVLVSKMSHCLYDLLIRQRSGEATPTRNFSDFSACRQREYSDARQCSVAQVMCK